VHLGKNRFNQYHLLLCKNFNGYPWRNEPITRYFIFWRIKSV